MDNLRTNKLQIGVSYNKKHVKQNVKQSALPVVPSTRTKTNNLSENYQLQAKNRSKKGVYQKKCQVFLVKKHKCSILVPRTSTAKLDPKNVILRYCDFKFRDPFFAKIHPFSKIKKIMAFLSVL